MGIYKDINTSSSKKIEDSLLNIRKVMFEPLLISLDLSENQIKTQNLDELRDSLERANEAIKHPESFGTVGVIFTAEAGAIVAKNKAESTLEVGILPLLLERQKQIKDRIRILESEKQINAIEGDLVRAPEGTDGQIKKDLETVKTQIFQIKKEQEQPLEEATVPEEIKIGALERKAKVYHSFLEKESVATILGAILLLGITIVQIAFIVSKITPSEILNNSYLIILGFFFGQTVSKVADRGSGET